MSVPTTPFILPSDDFTCLLIDTINELSIAFRYGFDITDISFAIAF